MDIPYVNQIEFTDIISNYSSKEIILTIIESYKYILISLQKLIDINVVHFDLKLENILFKKKTSNPRIIDFGISIPILDLTPNNYKTYFYIYAPSYYVWCLEINIINYLLHKTQSNLSSNEADLIATSYVANNKALEIFSDDFKLKFLEAAKKEVKKYVNIDRNEAITKLISYYRTWDNYSIAIVFLRIIALLFPTDLHKNKFIILFSQLLLLNIHPNPLKRLTIPQTADKFNNIFFIDGNVDDYITLSKIFNLDKINTTKSIKQDIFHLKKLNKKNT